MLSTQIWVQIHILKVDFNIPDALITSTCKQIAIWIPVFKMLMFWHPFRLFVICAHPWKTNNFSIPPSSGTCYNGSDPVPHPSPPPPPPLKWYMLQWKWPCFPLPPREEQHTTKWMHKICKFLESSIKSIPKRKYAKTWEWKSLYIWQIHNEDNFLAQIFCWIFFWKREYSELTGNN